MIVEINVFGPHMFGGKEYQVIKGSFGGEFSEKEDYNTIVRELIEKTERPEGTAS